MDLEKLVLPLSVNDKAFSAGVGGAIAVVTALVGAMSMAVKATFKWADELDSIQDVIGGTNEEAAALNFTLRKSGTSTETFNKSMVIMEKGLVKADGSLDTIGKSLDQWGISVKDSSGNLKTQQQLIGEVSKKYGTFATQQEKVNFLTEVFGRGGAEMIDFFDTLAGEGGIDAVTKKVKDLGLVIDPQRYEDFTRSLEEIKLAGLGLAIGFTEKLMPVFEGLLIWVNSFKGLSVNDALNKLTMGFANIGARFSEWAKNIDWAKVSADLIAGISGIDWATIGTNVGNGLRSIFGLKTKEVMDGVDWNGIFSAVGLAFADFVVGLAGGENWATVKSTWSANLVQLQQIVNNWWSSIKSTWSANWAQLKNIVTVWWINVKSTWSSNGMQLKQIVSTVFESIKNSITSSLESAINAGIGFINNLITAINSIPLVNIPTIGTTGGKGSSSDKERASGGYSAGMTLVGENGPELLNLPSGSYVNNNVSSQRMASQPTEAYISDESIRAIARIIGQQMQRA